MIDLRYHDVENELRAAVREMLADRCPPSHVLGLASAGTAYDLDLWRTLAVEMGLAGLAVPERFGGAGASWRETAVVCEELGRAVAPVPYLGSAVVATATLLACAPDSAIAADLLADLAKGERTAALAIPFATAPHAALPPQPGPVTDALTADVLIVLTPAGLRAVDTHETPGLVRREALNLDHTRTLCDLEIPDGAGVPLADGDAATRAVHSGLAAGAALLASEQVGVADWCLESTVDYVKARYQFGRPVGSFQAVKHRLADVWVGLAQARAAARYAAGCLAEGDPDTGVAIAVAKAHCSAVAVTAAEECVQLHGGIGFTWEHPAHLYLKKAKADAVGFGTAGQHRSALAALVGLPEAGRDQRGRSESSSQ